MAFKGLLLKIFICFIFISTSIYAQDPEVIQPDHTKNNKNLIIELAINGGIGPATQDYIARGIKFAKEHNAKFIILKINTPGGLEKSTRLIVQDILASPIPIVAYVAPDGARAASAGTFIVYAANIAAMAKGTHLGAATPISLGMQPDSQEEKGKTEQSALDKKVLNDSISFIKSLAEIRNRNAKFAEKTITESATYTASEALRNNVINLIADNETDLLNMLDKMQVLQNNNTFVLNTKSIEIQQFTPDWRTQFLQVITEPTVAYLLLLLGMYGIFFELMNPGFMLPGIVGAVSILVGLYALQLLPINYAGLGLLILGVIFIIAEAFLPSFGVLGFGGTAAFVIGSIFLIDSTSVDYQIPWSIIWTVAIINILILFSIIKIALKLRKRASEHGVEVFIGETGKAINPIHEIGQIMIKGEIWSAYSKQPIPTGKKVKVIGKNGLKLEVQEITESNEISSKETL